MTLTAPRPTAMTGDDVEALFREARRRQRRRIAATAALLLATIGFVAGGLIASKGGAPPRRPRTTHHPQPDSPPAAIVGHIVLRGDGLAGAEFGQPEMVAIDEIKDVVGAPLHAVPTDMAGNCMIDSAMQWPTLTAYFFHNRFVGYSTGSLNGYFLDSNASTVAGLRIGDSLAEAQFLYGDTLKTTTAQGGAWSVATPTGTLAGNFTAEVDQTPSLNPRIGDIAAGSVGCPAASP
jgi:hypothetical protein